jgi:hypothetical protein
MSLNDKMVIKYEFEERMVELDDLEHARWVYEQIIEMLLATDSGTKHRPVTY